MGEVLRLRNFIGGKWTDAASDDWLESVNPSQPSDIVAQVPHGSADDTKLAVGAAHSALEEWSASTGPSRAEYLYKWAAAIAARAEELAQEMAREVGKPISEARGEVGRCSMILRYYAGEAVREVGEVIPAQAPGALQFSMRQPLGVVGLITPWNFPLAIPLWKAAPALAFGNTVVLKSAEASSNMSRLLAETAEAAGLPTGVFNVLVGRGDTVGQALLDVDGLDGLSFTGSQKVGQRLAEQAAARNIKFQGEMGGKNVAIVLPDADLDQAAVLVAGGAMRYAGQKCTATSRAVVHDDVREQFLAKLSEQTAKLPIGPVTDPAAAIGPLISSDAQQRVLKDLEKHGVNARTDGDGFFIQPTILDEVDAGDDLARKELFAPVLAVIRANDVDEAISLANRTEYGLSASLFTRDIRSALRYVTRIKAGMVRVNGDTTGVDPHAPFGGMRASSTHSREQGPAAKDFYTDVKTVQINP